MIRLQLDTHQQRMLTQLVSGLPVLDPILGPWVAGGAVRSVALGTLDDVHDVDVFFRSAVQSDATKRRFEELGYTYEVGEHLGVTNYRTQQGKVIQLVHGKNYANVMDLYVSIAVTCCQFITDGHHIWAGPRALDDARNKRFVVVNGQHLSAKFICKYTLDYGYKYDGDVEALITGAEEWYNAGE